MGRSIFICRVAGVPFKLHWAYFIIPISWIFPALLDVRADPSGLLDAVVIVLLLTVSILLHELAHAMTGRAFGARVDSITLWALGGFTELSGMSTAPRAHVLMALAGPACTWALAGLGYALSGMPEPVGRYMSAVAFFGTWMGVLNLVPAYPLDGSQALGAALRARMGQARSDLLTARIGIVAAAGIVLYGLLQGQPFLVIIGIMSALFSYDLLQRNRFAGYAGGPGTSAAGGDDVRLWRLKKSELDAEIKRRRAADRADREVRERVDELLRQINEKGMDSLTEKDRSFLDAAARRFRKQGR